MQSESSSCSPISLSRMTPSAGQTRIDVTAPIQSSIQGKHTDYENKIINQRPLGTQLYTGRALSIGLLNTSARARGARARRGSCCRTSTLTISFTSPGASPSIVTGSLCPRSRRNKSLDGSELVRALFALDTKRNVSHEFDIQVTTTRASVTVPY
jgi:hypothetical protein